ncbi:Chagasin family peptidase inhibitor I42 [Mycobacterium rhizamassiliense]|jgi:inhibitor of cysteine peptidase|uniref:Chagasin family peptidase inhibitor I42 n=2 Tax=Mycobacterium rhizamassiliense TaxID=1841860 RepID=A0A2U3NX90_9MYCO|nr:Chagasin family peptidase inhibitor I42 [Mycobacterium rhizamassiliense]
MEEMAFVKIRVFVTVAMLLSSTLTGCHLESRNPPTSKTLQVSMDEVSKRSTITQNVTLGVGNTLKLQLGSNYSTPYRWAADAKIGDTGIMQQTSHQYVAPSTDALGAPGSENWTFTALKPGTTTISTNYSSFVGKNTPPVCQYSVIVTVQ